MQEKVFMIVVPIQLLIIIKSAMYVPIFAPLLQRKFTPLSFNGGKKDLLLNLLCYYCCCYYYFYCQRHNNNDKVDMVAINGDHQAAPASQPELVVPNPLRDKMLAGDVASTLIIKMMRGAEAAMLAKSTGFDGIFIDMEHSTLDLDATSQMCQAALLAGLTPIVRSPTKEPFFVSRILDGGALGVVVSL